MLTSITNIPELLSYLDIQESTITADALNTQTSVMEQIVRQGGHFVMMVKRNQPNSYEEIVRQFKVIKLERERMKSDPSYRTEYPEYVGKYDEVAYSEKTGTGTSTGSTESSTMHPLYQRLRNSGRL